ncbi:ArsR family transcriptional regulator [Micromonospora qiuiae]|uniref:ArsR family transcriptional regulator n=1 Tax=Micromonospora qiuiae TaxID=502268 RepID=A0ABQ4JKF7_9ACTN|nr:ArsR family transcriptional regulator [Micromonospora qiuiae]
MTALADTSRRTLYDYVRRQGDPVSREEAAAACHMSRSLAAFHLDKLVDAGLLRARYQAPPGQPRGRGRSPKVYQAADTGLTITIPERRYELIAEILADAVVDDPANADEAARRHAEHRGRLLGSQLRGTALLDALTGLGFEPDRESGTTVVLRNCPFHALATRQTALVCGLNHAFLTGLIDGLNVTQVQARLAPRPGACCVELAEADDVGVQTRINRVGRPSGGPRVARSDVGPVELSASTDRGDRSPVQRFATLNDRR